MIGPTSLDLTTTAQAVEWIFGAPQNAGQNTSVLQSLISSLSLDFLRRTGRASQNGSVPSQSPFNQAVSYSESYSGNGNSMLQLRNWPILSVSEVLVFSQPVPQSSGPTQWGWFVDDSGRFLCIRLGPYMTAGYGGSWMGGWSGLQPGTANGRGGWPKAIDCIQVTYSAGFTAQDVYGELQRIPVLPALWTAGATYGNSSVVFDGINVQVAAIIAGTSPTAKAQTTSPAWSPNKGGITPDGAYIAWTNQGVPYVLTVNQLPWLADAGITYFSTGDPLTAVQTAPAAGQYYVMGQGSYLFNSADAGSQIQISYSTAGTPADVQEAVLRWVNLIYKRRGWEGIRSLMQKDAGSTVYTAFEIDPSIEKTIRYYRRRA